MTVLLQGLTDDLKREPDTLEDLKFVLRVIADIRDKSLDVELRYVDIQERYRTILMYDIEVRSKIIISQSQPNCPCLKLHCMTRVANRFKRRRQLKKKSRQPCRRKPLVVVSGVPRRSLLPLSKLFFIRYCLTSLYRGNTCGGSLSLNVELIKSHILSCHCSNLCI